MDKSFLEFTYSLNRKFRNDISIFRDGIKVGKARKGEYIILNKRRFIYVYDGYKISPSKIYYEPQKFAELCNYKEEELDASANILYKNDVLKLNRSFFGSLLMHKGTVRLFQQDVLIAELNIEKKSLLNNSGVVRLYNFSSEEEIGVYLLALFIAKDCFSKRNDN